ncbi:helix-turn-helix domain-containing protein [Candidatus Agathobaculum pullicola]|uniref:helix-turn-helix domain-containing protein n=1 Tax=Candidatus Agathobaculum pullicola TaxID=2838426 RepID=UPI003F8E7B67
MNVANNIRKVVAQKGMVQKVVAERSGFTEQQFTDMLNGRKIIRADYVPKIAEALNCTLDDLFAAGDS